ncbi:MAG TPA: SIMPL domain-containing protein [Candidatus Baltobacteraceae bacterium]|nr:SIMPL domain-containing protein [Candidatus Baltobacteraceae bacterium]
MKHALILAAAAACTLTPTFARAQTTMVAPPAFGPTLTVQGDGVVERSPDQAVVQVTIVTNDDNASVSAGKNTDIYNALKTRVAALGVSGDALRTSYFNVQFVPHPARALPPEQQQPRYGYVTTRGIALTVTPIENAGKVIDAANAAGVTQVGDVSYDLKDRKGAYLSALAAAMSNARQVAEALAAAGGFKLGGYARISVEGSAPAPNPQAPRAMALAAPAQPPTDLGPSGPIEVRAGVTVSYSIK